LRRYEIILADIPQDDRELALRSGGMLAKGWLPPSRCFQNVKF
jgi:hypothetical protein